MKFLPPLIALIAAIGLTACGSSDKPATPDAAASQPSALPNSASATADASNVATAPTAAPVKSPINWTTNYDQAVADAKSSGKPLLLYFTGSDWCPWCQKLDQEILDTDTFAKAVEETFIFVKVDFPSHNAQPEALVAQNQKLKEQYAVRGLPTLLVVTGQGETLGYIGYLPVSPDEYATRLQALIKSGQDFHSVMKSFDSNSMSADQLKNLYQQADSLHRTNDANKILAVAIEKSPNDSFLLAQQYRQMVEEGKVDTAEAKAVRQHLLDSDPSQTREINLYVSYLDFRAHADLPEAQTNPGLAVAPLVQYLDKYGTQDTEYAWKIQYTIGEYYATHNHRQDALKYMQQAYQNAPAKVQPQIQQSIDLLQQTQDKS